jgi:hypothetical protein
MVAAQSHSYTLYACLSENSPKNFLTGLVLRFSLSPKRGKTKGNNISESK